MENKKYVVIDLNILHKKLDEYKQSSVGIQLYRRAYQEALRWVTEQTESIVPHIEEAFNAGCDSMKMHCGAWGNYSNFTNQDLEEFKKENNYGE